MAALTKDRNTLRRERDLLTYPVAANVKIYAGALVCLNASGLAVPGSTATTLTAVGRAEEQVDNTGGAASALLVPCRRGVYLFANDATDAVVQADVGKACYVVDDQTVAKTNGTNTRSAAGTVRGVESAGVWVEF